MTSKTEAAMIRSKLALRFNCEQGCWEVYTTLHGSGLFRWYKVDEATAQWYVKTFPEIHRNRFIPHIVASDTTGELLTYGTPFVNCSMEVTPVDNNG